MIEGLGGIRDFVFYGTKKPAIQFKNELVERPFTERSIPLFCLAANKQTAPSKGRALCFSPPTQPAKTIPIGDRLMKLFKNGKPKNYQEREGRKPGHYDFGDFNIYEIYECMRLQSVIENRWHQARSQQERWGIIREIYKILTPDIMEYGEEGNFGHVDPYYVDWCKTFTPIEYDAWCSIRYRGIGMYPQYPVYNYFLDFGNPFLKVALEMDGKAHSLTRDIERDLKLVELDWHVYRIKGVECYTKFEPYWEIEDNEYMDEDEKWNSMRDYYYYTSDGVIDAISMIYFDRSKRRSKYIDLAYQTLDKHRLVPFEIGKGNKDEEEDDD